METQCSTSREMLTDYLHRHYEEARNKKMHGGLVCWSSSVAPAELMEAMDIAVLYPENHAAAIAAKKNAPAMLALADEMEYSNDCCAYGRINMAYMNLLKKQAETGVTPKELEQCSVELMPLPDLLLACNNICNTILKWYENLAVELNVPLVLIDAPFNNVLPMQRHVRDYMAAQITAAAEQLSAICGRPFDWQRFFKVQEQTQRSVAQWDRVTGMLGYKPSPLSGFDLFNYMALIVCARYRDWAENTFRKLAHELEEKVSNQDYAFHGGEKDRIIWDGIAVWPYLEYTFHTLKDLGIIMTGSCYPDVWSLHYTPGKLDELAAAYGRVYMNTSVQNRADKLADIVAFAKCDGVVYHINRSCKLLCLSNARIAKLVQERTGAPYVFFDGDQADPNHFSPAQFSTRVQALSEMMTGLKEDAL